MSIFKETFKPGVQKQIENRQDALGTTSRSSDMIQYFNSRNSWIRMSSAVDVKGDGGVLASKCILQGGTLTNAGVGLVLKSGVGSGNQAYSTKTPGGQLNRLGIRPMPGITSLDVKSKSAYGSLREANVSFQCWDIKQLEELELLYMRPGYSVLVEWGWAPYLDNSTPPKLQPNVPLPPYLFQKLTKEQIWKEIYDRSAKDGNYDAAYGLVKNYSWKARSDGGYDCNVSIITMGEVLESLKINYGAYDVSSLKTNGLFPLVAAPAAAYSFNTGITKVNATTGLSGINVVAATNTTAIVRDDIAAAYAQNIVAGICAELYYKVSDNATVKSKDVAAHKIVDANNGGYEYNFLKYKVEMTSSGPTITDGSTQIYIRLEDFLEILNRYVLLSDKKHKTPLAKISVRERETKIPLLCLGNIHQISTNPHVCLIKNDAYLDPDTKLGVVGLNVTAVKTYLNEINSVFTYLNPSTEFGEIGNVFVNLDYLYGLSLNDTLAEKDKKEKNDIILFDYIKSMMSGINTAIGNVANFDIFIDPIDSVGRIIDVNYVDTTKRDDAYKNAFEIQVHNLKSTVRDYSLESQIFPEQSTMVAIGAQTKGGALGTNTSTLIDYNNGLVDRVIPQKEAPTSDSTASDADKLFELQKSWAIIADLFIQLIPDWFSAGDYDVEESSKYSNALKDIINFFTSIGNSNAKNRAIIPTKLSLTMDGIGGMVIGNMFRINNDILPAGYKGATDPKDIGSKIGYIVTGLGHKVSNNDWTTQVDAQFVVLDEPTGIAGFPSVQAINRSVTAVSGSVGVTPPAAPPSSAVSALGFGLPVATPYTITSPLFRALEKKLNTPVKPVASNHQGIDIQGPNGGNPNKDQSIIVGGKGTSGDGIFAVQDGKVIKAGGPGVKGFENWIYIHHTIGGKLYTSIYGHMPLLSIKVAVGDTVTKGQQLAVIGTEGKSTGYHLHFELWEGDRVKLLDPIDYLPFFKANGGIVPDTTIIKPFSKFS
jgi:murein DD-endopeptidase MepM/ murein hydrolase activator NlpD